MNIHIIFYPRSLNRLANMLDMLIFLLLLVLRVNPLRVIPLSTLPANFALPPLFSV